jgi:hypothetical protein
MMDAALNRSGNFITTGPLAGQILRLKQGIANAVGVTDPHIADAELISKLNAWLATDANKLLTSRGTQMEFSRFMEANPGLQNTPGGSKIMINYLGQLAQREIDESQLLYNVDGFKAQNQAIQDYEKKNPLLDPTTGQPLGASGVTKFAITPPKVGDVEAGPGGTHARFKGGDPSDPGSWEPAGG